MKTYGQRPPSPVAEVHRQTPDGGMHLRPPGPPGRLASLSAHWRPPSGGGPSALRPPLSPCAHPQRAGLARGQAPLPAPPTRKLSGTPGKLSKTRPSQLETVWGFITFPDSVAPHAGQGPRTCSRGGAADCTKSEDCSNGSMQRSFVTPNSAEYKPTFSWKIIHTQPGGVTLLVFKMAIIIEIVENFDERKNMESIFFKGATTSKI